MLDSSIMVTLTILTAIFTVLIFTLLFIMKMQKATQNYLKDQKSLIDSMRDSFEQKLYDLNERLVSTETRWKDVNHLLLTSQKQQNIDSEKYNEVYLTDFLKAAGINKEKLAIDKKLVFVLTPFNKRFDEVYKTIKEVCYSVGLKCSRGDEDYIKSDILNHILKVMIRARVVIANINGRNTNVFYELGLGHAMDKNTILISKSKNILPFDIKSKYIILYKDIDELKKLLKNELIKIFVSE